MESFGPVSTRWVWGTAAAHQVEGYRPRFVLTAVDLKTFKRTPRPSPEFCAKIVASTR